MTIKGRLTANIILNFVLLIAIVGTALVGIGFVKKKISMLTEQSTPFQTRTLDFQRALQSSVTDLMKVSHSDTEQELSVARAEAEKSLEEVKTAQQELAKLSDKSGDVHTEMAAIAKDVIAAATDQISSKKQSQGAWNELSKRLADASAQLRDLDSKIKGLQGGSSTRFIKSREAAGSMSSRLRNMEAIRLLFKDLQLVSLEIHQAQDKKGVLLNKGKVTMALNSLLQNEYVKEKSVLTTDIKRISGKADEFIKAKSAYVGVANEELKGKYETARKELLQEISAIGLAIEQEAVALSERAKVESQQQGEVFTQFSASNDVLAATAVLLATASSVEGSATRLMNVSSAKEIDDLQVELSKSFEKITAIEVALTKSLQKINAKQELKTLGGVKANLAAIREGILGKDGISGKIRNQLAMEQKSLDAMGKMKTVVVKQSQSGRQAITTAKEEQVKAIVSVNQMVNFNRILLVAIGVIGLVIGLLMGVWLYRAIMKPLTSCIDAVDRIADGNLTVELAAERKDELGKLLSAVRRMADNLKDIISQVKGSAQMVSSESELLYSTSEQMANGAEQVASQACTVATASEEMAATSGEIASNCLSAAESSGRAGSAAEAGAAVVDKTVAGMGRIAERVKKTAISVENLGSRSDQIGQIISTIKDIADQTNLLALNAAIEAARAGEQGRGFAVVADEVRALAERTTAATLEISTMIKAIQAETKDAVVAMEQGVREVEQGTEDASRSGEVLREILNQVMSVSMQVSQIATAAEQQTATTGEISSNIHQITEVVQQTARGAQESASAARHLTELSAELQKLVGRFQV